MDEPLSTSTPSTPTPGNPGEESSYRFQLPDNHSGSTTDGAGTCYTPDSPGPHLLHGHKDHDIELVFGALDGHPTMLVCSCGWTGTVQ